MQNSRKFFKYHSLVNSMQERMIWTLYKHRQHIPLEYNPRCNVVNVGPGEKGKRLEVSPQGDFVEKWWATSRSKGSKHIYTKLEGPSCLGHRGGKKNTMFLDLFSLLGLLESLIDEPLDVCFFRCLDTYLDLKTSENNIWKKLMSQIFDRFFCLETGHLLHS